MSRTLVPDTSVIVSGRLSAMVEAGELDGATFIIAEAVLSELEHQAVLGRESGITGIDEIGKLQSLAGPAELTIRFEGDRPHPEDLELGRDTEVRTLVRDVAEQADGELVTADRVQAHIAKARGLTVTYLHPFAEDAPAEVQDLRVLSYFEDDTMSVHLKSDCLAQAKRGRPGEMELVELGTQPLVHAELSTMAREIIEAARRDHDSFVEIEREGATVCQLGNLRIAIARPPFSDGIEITAVRPVKRLALDDYELADDVRERLSTRSRGIFVSGPPGSGKSTFAQAVADHLKDRGTIVKTMESPRDLQVDASITQYAPLEGSMELTGDVLLLVRPDHVIWDEVRKTVDFSTFADMRLAGVGMIGVTHANRAIDAVQRLLGRVELGMIPQIVDTVVHIEDGAVREVLELALTVKVPAGMTEQDLARPVVEVRELGKRKARFELYTYGEQVVVMPLDQVEDLNAPDKVAEAEQRLVQQLRRHIRGDFEVEMQTVKSATVYVESREASKIIGPGGWRIKKLQGEVGVRLDIRTFDESDARREHRQASRRVTELTPQFRKTQKHLILILEPRYSGSTAEVCIDGEVLFEATVGRKGEVRVRMRSPEGEQVLDAVEHGDVVSVRV